MRYEHVIGDVQLHPHRVVDGWCWAPSRPQARLRFDLLADDRIVASGEASLPRPDLSVRGMIDTQHGFRLTLPPDALDRGRPVLLSARERRSRVVFGRHLIEPAEPIPQEPGIGAARETLGALSERLTALVRPLNAPATRLREACFTLGTTLPARAAGHGAGTAAARKLLGRAGAVVLARPAMPRATLVLAAEQAAPATLERLRTLAPATRAIEAETMLLDPGRDALMALLPSLVAGLCLVPAQGVPGSGMLALVAGRARGDWLLLLDGDADAAALPSLLARLEAQAVTLATAPRRGAEGLPRLRLAARSGVTLAARRNAVRETDTPASLLTRLAGAACVVLEEPWPAPRVR